jgi:hypothetical protein
VQTIGESFSSKTEQMVTTANTLLPFERLPQSWYNLQVVAAVPLHDDSQSVLIQVEVERHEYSTNFYCECSFFFDESPSKFDKQSK